MQNLLRRILVCWSCLVPFGLVEAYAQETPPASSLSAENTISIHLASGRTFTAALDVRTDADRLWLRFRQAGAEVFRPIDWDCVVSAEVADQDISGAEFHRLIQQLRQKMPAQPVAPAIGTNIEMIGSPDTVQMANALSPPVETRRVVSLDIDVRVGRWDENAEPDGLVVRVYPLDANGNIVPVRGTLNVDLKIAPRSRDLLHQPLVDAGHWSEALRMADFSPAGAICRLPFQSIHPEFEDQWLSPGSVHACLAVPGQGTFEASCYVGPSR